MSKRWNMISWLANTRPGNVVAAAGGVLVALVIAVAAAYAAEQPDAPSAPTVNKMVEAPVLTPPSVNLTSNDPAYMETPPAPVETTTTSATASSSTTPETSTTAPTETPAPSVAPTRTVDTTPPVTTVPETPTSPEARPTVTPCGLAACPSTTNN